MQTRTVFSHWVFVFHKSRQFYWFTNLSNFIWPQISVISTPETFSNFWKSDFTNWKIQNNSTIKKCELFFLTQSRSTDVITRRLCLIDLIVFTDNNLRTRQHYIVHEIHYSFIYKHLLNYKIYLTLREPSENRKDLQASTLVGPTRDNPVLDSLAVLHLNNWLYKVRLDMTLHKVKLGNLLSKLIPYD